MFLFRIQPRWAASHTPSLPNHGTLTSHLSTHAPRGICTKILSCLVLHEVQSTRIFHYYLPPIYQHYHSGGTLRRPISTSKVAQTIPTELRLACHNLYQELGSRHTDSVNPSPPTLPPSYLNRHITASTHLTQNRAPLVFRHNHAAQRRHLPHHPHSLHSHRCNRIPHLLPPNAHGRQWHSLFCLRHDRERLGSPFPS